MYNSINSGIVYVIIDICSIIVGKMPDNEVLLKELSLTPAAKIMMMGSIESDVVRQHI